MYWHDTHIQTESGKGTYAVMRNVGTMVVVVRPSKKGENDCDFKLTTSGRGSEDG